MVWSKVELLGPNRDGEQRRFAIASGTAVSQYKPLYLEDARTVNVTQVLGKPIAGVAAHELMAKENKGVISAITQGIFRAVASGAITFGSGTIMSAESDWVEQSLETIYSGAAVTFGYSFDDVSHGETLSLRLML